jgi:hypothetical protein
VASIQHQRARLGQLDAGTGEVQLDVLAEERMGAGEQAHRLVGDRDRDSGGDEVGRRWSEHRQCAGSGHGLDEGLTDLLTELTVEAQRDGEEDAQTGDGRRVIHKLRALVRRLRLE